MYRFATRSASSDLSSKTVNSGVSPERLKPGIITPGQMLAIGPRQEIGQPEERLHRGKSVVYSNISIHRVALSKIAKDELVSPNCHWILQ